jgi:hypothetical protein
VEGQAVARMIWRSTVIISHTYDKKNSLVRGRGNTLIFLKGERVEWNLTGAAMAKEMQRLVCEKQKERQLEQEGDQC